MSFQSLESFEVLSSFAIAAQNSSWGPRGFCHLPFPLSCSPGDQLGAGVSALVPELLSHGPLS